MQDQDRRFLETILGRPGEGAGWRTLFRHGSVLTLTRTSARRDLPSLYRPQKGFSRLAYGLVGLSRRFGIPGPQNGKILQFSEGRESLVHQIEGELEAKVVSLLIGNPVQSQRRFLGLVEGFQGRDRSVLKAGFTSEARWAIESERTLLRKLGGRVPGVPPLLGELNGPGSSFQAFLLDWVTGRKATESEALGHLDKWSGEGKKPLREFPEWPGILGQWNRAGLGRGQGDKAGAIRLTPSLMHGDYAPWNLLVDQEENFRALDWEAAREDGIPALDWVHYLYQIEKLLGSRGFAPSLERIGARLRLGDSRAFLNRVGWGEDWPWLIMVYLATNWLIGDRERPELLRTAEQFLFQDHRSH